MNKAEAISMMVAHEPGKPHGLKNKHWPDFARWHHNNGMPIVLNSRQFKQARLARKKARAKARVGRVCA